MFVQLPLQIAILARVTLFVLHVHLDIIRLGILINVLHADKLCRIVLIAQI